MKRREPSTDARFLTFSCYRHRPLLQPDWAKDIFVEQLAVTKDRFDLLLYAWVVMPDHVHLLLATEHEIADITRILIALKTRSSARILARYREQGHGMVQLWEHGGGHDRNIFSGKEAAEKIRYIALNPVRSGLCETVEEYRWSFMGSDAIEIDSWN